MPTHDISGILCLNKPQGATSHDMVNKMRRLFGTKKVGHTGTLDPLATGVLVILIGRAVKASDILYFVQSDIFDKSKVLLKLSVLVVFYSPINCRRQYHCEAISLANSKYHSPKGE